MTIMNRGSLGSATPWVAGICAVAVGAACATVWAQANRASGSGALAGTTELPFITIYNPSPSVIDQYTHAPDDIVAAAGGGPYISFAGLPGHIPGDSERTAVEIRSRSRTGNNIEETALDVEMKDATGLTSIWRPRQRYPAGSYISSGNPRLIYQAERTCVSSPDGPEPSGMNDRSDGTCVWHYKHKDNDGKSASLLSGVIDRNGGKLWGQAIDVLATRGSMGSDAGLPGGLLIGQEVDVGNFAKDCPITPSDCLVAGLFIAGSSKYRGTAGILGGGQPPDAPLYHQGVVLLPYFASDVGFNDDSSSNVGFQSNGVHGAFAFQDLSTAPTSINVAGIHSFAGYADTSSTPIAISLQGQYRQYQIKGHGFSVGVTGNVAAATLKITPLTVASLPTCSPEAEGTFAAVIDASSLSRNAPLSGHGSYHIPVYCNGSSWTAL